MSKKEPRSTPLSRPPLERMLRIHQEIQSGKFPNATSLAAGMEVSTKSIHRDMEFMRDRLSLPLEYDSRRNGYYYTESVSAFPTMQITEGELFALVVAEKALQQYRGTSFEKPLLSAFQKMASSLPETVSIDLEEWNRSISFKTSVEPIIDLVIFDKLSRATAHLQQLEILYRKPGQSEPEKRVIDPYHLANINGEWFLFAFDHLRRDVRTFVPSRIQELKETGKTFSRSKSFSIEKRLKDSFGVRSAEGLYQVKIHFSAEVADYIREKRWHQSQVLRELAGGALEMELKVSGLSEVKRWILGWGGQAQAIEPPELVADLSEAGERLQQVHSSPSGEGAPN